MAATNGGPAVWAMVVHPGPTDLLSLTDAAEHFRRLGLATAEADLQQRIAGRPTSEVPALRHREELDRILAVRLAGIERMINMAPLLQRGIDQFLAKDQRVGEANAVFARDLLGAFAALVTQGVAEFNGEQNNGPSSVPAVGEGQDAPTLADVAAASLDGL